MSRGGPGSPLRLRALEFGGISESPRSTIWRNGAPRGAPIHARALGHDMHREIMLEQVNHAQPSPFERPEARRAGSVRFSAPLLRPAGPQETQNAHASRR